MITFKQFIVEDTGEKMAVKMASHLLGSPHAEEMHGDRSYFEKIVSGAKHQAHKYVDTVNGPWVLTHFKNGNREFVKVDPPKGSSKKTMYFVPSEGSTLS